MRVTQKTRVGLLIAILFTIAILIYSYYVGKIRIHEVIGIDVSSHQGEIEWKNVATQKISFAYIKATEADDLTDSMFKRNWSEAKSAGIKIGAYHYYSLRFTGKAQAVNFINTVPVETDALPPVVDLEYVGNSTRRPTKDEFQKELRTYIDIIQSHYDMSPVIYTTDEFYRDYLSPEFSNEKFWVRNILGTPDETINWELSQYSQWGEIEGIKGRVDLDYSNQK